MEARRGKPQPSVFRVTKDATGGIAMDELMRSVVFFGSKVYQESLLNPWFGTSVKTVKSLTA